MDARSRRVAVERGTSGEGTIADNSSLATGGTGGGLVINGSPLIRNTIIWNNTGAAQIVVATGTPEVRYCCVKNGFSGTGNISAAPQLYPSYRMANTSPCIDAGEGDPATEPLDYDGQSAVDMPGVVNAGSGVDIGGREMVDMDNDGLDDGWEMAVFGSLAATDGTLDTDGDGTTDAIEYQNGMNPLVPDLRMAFEIGDCSDSQNESYRMYVPRSYGGTLLSGSGTLAASTFYGGTTKRTDTVPRGVSFDLTMGHIAHRPSSTVPNDYDYLMKAGGLGLRNDNNATPPTPFGPTSMTGQPHWLLGPGYIVYDPDYLLGIFWQDNPDASNPQPDYKYFDGKSARVFTPWLDIRADMNDNNSIDAGDPNDAREETPPGLVIGPGEWRKIRLDCKPADMWKGTVTLTATRAAGATSHIKVYPVSTGGALPIIDTAAGTMSTSWTLSSAQTFGTVGLEYWVVGDTVAQTAGEIELKLEYTPPTGADAAPMASGDPVTGISLCPPDKIVVTIIRTDLVEIKGLYKEDGSYVIGYTSDDDKGRIYCNRTYKSADPATLEWNKDEQYIDVTVEIEPSGVTLPSDARIVWELWDEDDPSDAGMDSVSAKAVDPNDYDGTDSDGDGADKEKSDNTGSYDGYTTIFEEISSDYALTVDETRIKDGLSKVRIHLTDDSGDNYVVKAKLKLNAGATPCNGDETGVMTIWKKIDGEYRKMIATKTLPVDQVQAYYDKAFVEWDFHDEGSSTSYEYISPTPGYDAYCQKTGTGAGQFSHRGDGGWHFVCAARKFATYADADPYGPQASGTATVLSDFVLEDSSANFTPGAFAGLKIIKINPGAANEFSFLIDNNTDKQITISPFKYMKPDGTVIRSLHLNSTEIGLGSPVNYEIREGGITGITPGLDANVLVFRETLEHIHANRTSPPPLDTMLLRTLVHELMHSFELNHNCGNADVSGSKSCVGSWLFAPVFNPDGTYGVKPESTDFCGEHIKAIRKANGYGGE